MKKKKYKMYYNKACSFKNTTVKHIIREVISHDLFTRLYFRDLSYILL